MKKYFDIIRKRLRLFVLGWVVFMLALLAIRLSEGPMAVDGLKPMIISRLERDLPGTRASIGHMELVWFGDARALGLRFQDIEIRDDKNRMIARAGHMEAALAADSLILAHVAPARLTADDFSVVASVSKGGRYDLGYEAHGNPETVSGLDTFLTDLTGPEKLGQPISFTRQLSLKDGQFRLLQEGSTLDWNAHVATIDFSKLHRHISAHVNLSLDSGGGRADVKAAAEGVVGLKQASITADIGNLVPSRIFPSVGVTQYLSTVDAPVNGRARVDYSVDRGFQGGYIDLNAGAGHLDLGHVRQDFDGANVTATYTSASHTFVFQKFRLNAHLIQTDLRGTVRITPEDTAARRDLNIAFDFYGPRVTGRLADDFPDQTLLDAHFKGAYTPRLRQLRIETGTGRLNGAPFESQGVVFTDDKGQLGADLTAKIKGRFTKDEVFAFWPEDLSHQVRDDLIDRIQGGDYANADFVLKTPPGHFGRLENADLRLDFDFKDMGLRIEKRLQNAGGLRGHGVLLGNSFGMDVTGGHLVNVELTHGGLLVPDFRDHTTQTHIWLESAGEAVNVIEAIDPLADNQLGPHGLNRERLSGNSKVRLDIRFPTFHEITNQNFSLTFDAHLTEAGLKQAALGWDLTGGDLTVRGDLLADKLEVEGPAHLGPYQGQIAYLTQFVPKTQHITFGGSFNAAQFGGSPHVPVPIKGDVTVINGKGQGTIDSDIFRGNIAWSDDDTGKPGAKAAVKDERPSHVVIDGVTKSDGMEAQGLPIFEHLKRELPTRITLLRSGEIWSGEVDAEALSGDIAYIQGERPRLVYTSTITPDEARELGYGALPMFRDPRHLTVNIALDSQSKEALLKLDQINATLGWSEVPGSEEPLRRLKMVVLPDDWETLGLPKAFFRPKAPMTVTALWQQTSDSLSGHVQVADQDVAFDMPITHKVIAAPVANPVQAVVQALQPPPAPKAAPYELQVRGTVNDTLLEALGYTQRPVRIKGVMPLVFSLYNTPGQPAAVLNLDATGAELGIQATDWKKPVGEAAQFAVSFDDQGMGQGEAQGVNLSRIYGSGDHVHIDGRASFSSRGDLEFADFSNLYLKDFIDVAFQYYDLKDQQARVISISGQQLDLRPWLQAPTDDAAGNATPAVTGPDKDEDYTPRPTHIVLDLAQLKASSDGAFTRLKFDVNWDGRDGIDGRGEGLALDNSPMAVVFRSEGTYSLFSLKAKNIGNVVRTATGVTNINGGTAEIEGAYRDGQIDASVRGDTIRVKQIPVLAQLLTVASLTGLNDTLTGEGIAFSDFDFPVRYRDHVLFIRDGYAKGKALGINVWGTINMDSKALALNGTLIPAYSINSIFGDVKSNGLGLVGLKYGVSGTYKTPVADVNPLSVMMPGFMKVWAQSSRKDPITPLDLPKYKENLAQLRDKVDLKAAP